MAVGAVERHGAEWVSYCANAKMRAEFRRECVLVKMNELDKQILRSREE